MAKRLTAQEWLRRFAMWAKAGFRPNDPMKPPGQCPPYLHPAVGMAGPDAALQVPGKPAVTTTGMTADEVEALMAADIQQAIEQSKQHAIQQAKADIEDMEKVCELLGIPHGGAYKHSWVAQGGNAKYEPLTHQQRRELASTEAGRALMMQELAARFNAYTARTIDRCIKTVTRPAYTNTVSAGDCYTLFLCNAPLRGVKPRPVEERHQLEI